MPGRPARGVFILAAAVSVCVAAGCASGVSGSAPATRASGASGDRSASNDSTTAANSTSTRVLVALQVSSRSLRNGSPLPPAQMSGRFGVTGGKDRSPQLSWSAGPSGTRSYAVTVFDPDARRGFWHWAVIDLPAATLTLPEGAGTVAGTALPAGARQAVNDGGTADYVGAAPPLGDPVHHYHVVVTALDVATLPVPKDAQASSVMNLINQHALASGEIIATARRRS